MDLIIMIIEQIGIVAFAISGAITGIRKKMDLFGVVLLGIVTAVGGGVLRDVIIGETPPVAFRDPRYTVIACAAALVIFFPCVRSLLNRRQKLFDLALFAADTIGMAVFTVVGIQGAMAVLDWYNPFLLGFVGVITGTGGGLLRDILAGNMPYMFRKHIYITASLLGAVCYLCLLPYLAEWVAMVLSVILICLIRVLSSRYRWNLPQAKACEEWNEQENAETHE